jgi:hypothetical protein
MRTSLFHRSSRSEIDQRHASRRGRRLSRLRRGDTIRATKDERPSAIQTTAAPEEMDAPEETDTPVGRAQAAGGPVDQATYVCSCGLMFSAPVSTTVVCPHCGAEQAW